MPRRGLCRSSKTNPGCYPLIASRRTDRRCNLLCEKSAGRVRARVPVRRDVFLDIVAADSHTTAKRCSVSPTSGSHSLTHCAIIALWSVDPALLRRRSSHTSHARRPRPAQAAAFCVAVASRVPLAAVASSRCSPTPPSCQPAFARCLAPSCLCPPAQRAPSRTTPSSTILVLPRCAALSAVTRPAPLLRQRPSIAAACPPPGNARPASRRCDTPL